MHRLHPIGYKSALNTHKGMMIMKKIFCSVLSLIMIISLTACGKEQTASSSGDVYKPSKDTSASCNIRIVGSYENFEALEKYSKTILPRVYDDFFAEIKPLLTHRQKNNLLFSLDL